jgi:hypothetical protein
MHKAYCKKGIEQMSDPRKEEDPALEETKKRERAEDRRQEIQGLLWLIALILLVATFFTIAILILEKVTRR